MTRRTRRSPTGAASCATASSWTLTQTGAGKAIGWAWIVASRPRRREHDGTVEACAGPHPAAAVRPPVPLSQASARAPGPRAARWPGGGGGGRARVRRDDRQRQRRRLRRATGSRGGRSRQPTTARARRRRAGRRPAGARQAPPGVTGAGPLLEQTATIVGPRGHVATVDLAGTDIGLAQLNGLAQPLPAAVFSSDGIGLSATTARELGVTASGVGREEVTLRLRGKVDELPVAAVLGREAAGVLSQARVAVMSLARLQQLAGLQGRLTRILVETRPGRQAAARTELDRLAGGRITVAAADIDVAMLHQALRPSNQASGFFAAISALLGFLFAFNAMLLTVPERRQAIADMRLNGTRRAAIVQIVAFQALCLGIAASLAGLLAGYALSRGAFHQSSGYLAEAFTLGTNTVIGVQPVLLSVVGGVLATLLASAVPLRDLQRGRALDAVYFEDGAPGNALGARAQMRLALAAAALVALATTLFRLRASPSFVASGVLALATMLAVPLAFAGVLAAAGVLAGRWQRLMVLEVALSSMKATTVRSLALAATGAVAIFGAIALGGSRSDLLRGIGGFAHSYAADADLWVGNSGDNQATVPFAPDHYVARIARLPGVASVSAFQGGFMELGDRRVWIIARPPGD